MTTTANSEFVEHRGCDKCGSSDALATYSDGHGYCFNCQSYFKEVGKVMSEATNVVSYTFVVSTKIFVRICLEPSLLIQSMSSDRPTNTCSESLIHSLAKCKLAQRSATSTPG